MTGDDILITIVLVCIGIYFTVRDRFAYRSPKLFTYGGLYLKLWNKQYRVWVVTDPRLNTHDEDDDQTPPS